MVKPRRVTQIFVAEPTPEGHGAIVCKSVGSSKVRTLPPFVVCEHFWLTETGRPPSPCRGLQKITVTLQSTTIIQYSHENTITLGPGDVTSVMVGRGVIRSVKPSLDEPTSSGVHIWLDVPEQFKRVEAKEVVVKRDQVSTVHPFEGVSVRLITGSAFGQTANVMLTITPATILECEIIPGKALELDVPDSWTAFVYVVAGACEVNGDKVPRNGFAEFARQGTEDVVGRIQVGVDKEATDPVYFFLGMAEPLGQPIYKQGPFVDVSASWIRQAYEDYSDQKNGFERNQKWNDHSSVNRF